MDKFDERTEAVLDRANRYLLIGHPNEKTVLRLIIASALHDAFSQGMEQEREVCANVAKNFALENGPTHNKKMGGFAIARLIRSRSTQDSPGIPGEEKEGGK